MESEHKRSSRRSKGVTGTFFVIGSSSFSVGIWDSHILYHFRFYLHLEFLLERKKRKEGNVIRSLA